MNSLLGQVYLVVFTDLAFLVLLAGFSIWFYRKLTTRTELEEDGHADTLPSRVDAPGKRQATGKQPAARDAGAGTVITDEFQRAFDLVEHGSSNIFVTGKAGTGKSTFLRYLREHLTKEHVVLAPTGLAAFNVEGATIHSFFQFPPRCLHEGLLKTTERDLLKFACVDVYIIDEISMVRSDVMWAIDHLLCEATGSDDPFGGKQLVFIGDMLQLPPVVTDKERRSIMIRFGGKFFFDIDALRMSAKPFEIVEFTRVFRQDKSELDFVEALNRIRLCAKKREALAFINERVSGLEHGELTPVLVPTKQARDSINNRELSQLDTFQSENLGVLTGGMRRYRNGTGRRPPDEDDLPVPLDLYLKEGAPVMMAINDPQGRWVNGSMGKLMHIREGEDLLTVNLSGVDYEVEPYTWEETTYKYQPKSRTVVPVHNGSFTQFPLRVCYAMTIHKSQGQSLSSVHLDIGKGAFAPGQLYVGLSRCRSLGGLSLQTKIGSNSVIVSPRIQQFYKTLEVPPKRDNDWLEVRDVISKVDEAAMYGLSLIVSYRDEIGALLKDRLLTRISILDQEHGVTNRFTGFDTTKKEAFDLDVAQVVRASVAD